MLRCEQTRSSVENCSTSTGVTWDTTFEISGGILSLESGHSALTEVATVPEAFAPNLVPLLNPRRHAPYVGEFRGRRHLVVASEASSFALNESQGEQSQ